MAVNYPYRIACIVGARPNFMKMAPILKAFDAHGGFAPRLIHTGQHYDVQMNAVFFDQLGLPEPDCNLEVGSGSQTVQTARIMTGLEATFEQDRPDLVLVVGDVNSTVAAALVGAKMHIPIGHVEAGLRSFDRDMPEEVNRLVTDRLATILFTTERDAGTQLEREGVTPDAIHFVGNVMIDSLMANLDRAVPLVRTLADRGTNKKMSPGDDYAVVTLHRPSNVDDPAQLRGLLEVLAEFSERMPVFLTLHPRTRARIDEAGLEHVVDRPNLHLLAPLSYFEMLGAVRGATIVITDSGGLQEETTALGVPCLTVRDNTERPITITQGTNILVGSSPAALRLELEAPSAGGKRGRIPELWDGHAAERIANAIVGFLADRQDRSGGAHPR